MDMPEHNAGWEVECDFAARPVPLLVHLLCADLRHYDVAGGGTVVLLICYPS